MKKYVALYVVLVMLFAFTIPAAAGGNGPGNMNVQQQGLNTDPGTGSITSTGPGPETSAGPGPMTSAGPGPEASAGPGPMMNYSTGVMTATRQGPGGPIQGFSLTGTIGEIGTDSLTINVLHGSKLAQPSIGTAVSISVTDQTRYLSYDGGIAVEITFADLAVDDPVSVRGLVLDGDWTATRVTVGASLVHVP